MIQKSMGTSPTEWRTGVPSEQELKKINRLANRPMAADELYRFTVLLCDNEVDRDLERFSIPALESLAEMFVGKGGIFDHSGRGRDQAARLYECWVEQDESRRTRGGEPYTMLKGNAYMLRDSALAREIEAGIKREISVSCSVARTVCSVCGADGSSGPCPHEKGKRYHGILCCSILEEPRDAYEWSFVAVPAQPAAGVTKAFQKLGGDDTMADVLDQIQSAGGSVTLSGEQARELAKRMDRLQSLARDGERYRKELCTQIQSLCMTAAPQARTDKLKAILDRLTADELGEVRKIFAGQADRKSPPAFQFDYGTGSRERTDADNSAFRMEKGVRK